MTKASQLLWIALGVLGGAVALNAGCTINSTDNDDDDDGGTGNVGNGSSSSNPSSTGAGASGGGGTGGEGTGGYAGSPTTGTGTLPGTCDPDPKDDACTACAKSTCCNEIEACLADATCEQQYNDINACLFPDGNWSGYDTNYCKLAVLGENPDATKAGALVNCITKPDQCGVDGKCGEEVPDTWSNFVADFTEQYCVGCHTTGYVSDGGVDTADYSTDAGWFEPFGEPNWFAWMNLDAVKADADLWWCGLATAEDGVPAECAGFTWSAQQAADCAGSANSANCSGTVQAGKPRFPKPERFPPHRDGMPPSTDHFGYELHCWWMPNVVCEQPDAVTRRRVISWIVAGMPE